MTKSKIINKEHLLNQLEEAINKLTDAENEIVEYINLLDELQAKILDIEHFLEINVITDDGALNIISELQMLRKTRRDVKQLWDIWNVYGTHKEKIKEKTNRQFLIAELHKCDKSLQTTYKNRVYDEEYLHTLNMTKKEKRGRKKKLLSYNNNEGENNESNS